MECFLGDGPSRNIWDFRYSRLFLMHSERYFTTTVLLQLFYGLFFFFGGGAGVFGGSFPPTR